MTESEPTIVLCVATSDYVDKWDRCIRSHNSYCGRWGYEYELLRTTKLAQPKWRKLSASLLLVKAGHDVLLIDADAEFMAGAPSLESLLSAHPNADIFCVRGHSGRANSGVMLFRGGADGRAARFLSRCLDGKGHPVPMEDFVTHEGENGHVIRFLRDLDIIDGVAFLDRRWNNTVSPEADDAIRHYTAKMRSHYRQSWRLKERFFGFLGFSSR